MAKNTQKTDKKTHKKHTQKNNKNKNHNIKTNNVVGPDGQGQEMSRPNARPHPDSGPDDHQITNQPTYQRAGKNTTQPTLGSQLGRMALSLRAGYL